ncbi:AglZ/HisF2 family acetamidino modification protein [Sphingorhabdus lacus]|uniref:Imidazole glycerol phosphate synthase subunit HisF n=1 Tax=Sphingorhabdus lacus TaxID=392610 RepID=A0A6I6LG43_9SPHN|nr:AglZ/HisF2 family acetamidino modification protein [Sphingorhabdus lacus]QGY81312.1 imidazole glycerol phosphate synthase cyclase subunit [Sphingorhabdus lacus]
MLRSRLIPVLLLRDGGLVKTTKFANDRYVGDPINAVRIFNEKEVDELMVIDLDATVNSSAPDYEMIDNLARECRMPLSYGGGVSNADQAQRIMELGVEKVALSSHAVARPETVAEIAAQVGSQSVSVVLDVKKRSFGGYRVWTHNGTRDSKKDPVSLASAMENAGAGEIIVNSIDRDGTITGYDLDLCKRLRDSISVPLTILGGAGTLNHFHEAADLLGTIGLAAGSFFVFKGQYRAVLISYPNNEERKFLQS